VGRLPYGALQNLQGLKLFDALQRYRAGQGISAKAARIFDTDLLRQTYARP
jgi:hypothetical protein